jgi:hypothetical protein
VLRARLPVPSSSIHFQIRSRALPGTRCSANWLISPLPSGRAKNAASLTYMSAVVRAGGVISPSTIVTSRSSSLVGRVVVQRWWPTQAPAR